MVTARCEANFLVRSFLQIVGDRDMLSSNQHFQMSWDTDRPHTFLILNLESLELNLM